MDAAPPIDCSDNPDKQRLRSVGRMVRERLLANPAIYQLPSEKAELFAVGEFLSPEECQRLITMIDAVAKPSRAFDLDYSSGYRTSFSGDPDPGDPFVKRIQRRFDDLLGLDPSYGETIQGQRYMPGQQFKPHTDWFPTNAQYWKTERRRGGQRSFTAMAFLNGVEEGGHTAFPWLGLSIQPQPGALLIWNNADADGVPNAWTMHSGEPVVRGVKYIITKWYRTKRWY